MSLDIDSGISSAIARAHGFLRCHLVDVPAQLVHAFDFTQKAIGHRRHLFHDVTIDDAIFPASCYRQALGFSRSSSNTWLFSAAQILGDDAAEDWVFAARDAQLPPPDLSWCWLFFGGRGTGKSHSMSAAAHPAVRAGIKRIHFIAPTTTDFHDVNVEGKSVNTPARTSVSRRDLRARGR